MSIKCKDILPPTLEQQLRNMGANLRLARKRRKWSVENVRQKIKCSKGTLQDAEKGKPTVNMGVYLMLLDLYGFEIDLVELTHPKNDAVGWSLQTENTSSKPLDVFPDDF